MCGAGAAGSTLWRYMQSKTGMKVAAPRMTALGWRWQQLLCWVQFNAAFENTLAYH